MTPNSQQYIQDTLSLTQLQDKVWKAVSLNINQLMQSSLFVPMYKDLDSVMSPYTYDHIKFNVLHPVSMNVYASVRNPLKNNLDPL